MKRFLFKVLLFCSPFLIPVILYFVIDPFKVLYTYEEQVNTNKDYQIFLNRDFQGTQLFLRNYKQYNYDAFILGNSRSFFYNVDTWNKYINASCFHFNAASESLFGVYTKLDFLDERNVKIHHALVVIDYPLLSFTSNKTGHLLIKHPATSKQSWAAFHYEMFKGFFPKSVIPLTDLYLTDKKKLYMIQYGVKNNIWKHNMITNQLLLKVNPDPKFMDEQTIFYKRSKTQKFAKPIIGPVHRQMLNEIQRIFAKHRTDFKIILSPNYEQEKLNPADRELLNTFFGKSNIYDFSGINSFTNNTDNYYETAHYKPQVCDSIMAIVYGKSTWNGFSNLKN
jgi:hypothetical protein